MCRSDKLAQGDLVGPGPPWIEARALTLTQMTTMMALLPLGMPMLTSPTLLRIEGEGVRNLARTIRLTYQCWKLANTTYQ